MALTGVATAGRVAVLATPRRRLARKKRSPVRNRARPERQ